MIDPINKSINIECFIATTPYLRVQAAFNTTVSKWILLFKIPWRPVGLNEINRSCQCSN